MYDLLSCGFMVPSSILADASNARPPMLPGEACRLMVADERYSHAFIDQVGRVCSLISHGVGVGFGASRPPLYPTPDESGVRPKLKSGFVSLMQKLESCNLLHIHERKPKVAVYIHAQQQYDL